MSKRKKNSQRAKLRLSYVSVRTLQFKFRWLLFLLYFAIVFTLPFGFLANTTGTLIGLTLFCVILLYLKSSARARLLKRLNVTRLFPIDQPGLFASLTSFSSRLSIPPPQVFLCRSPGLNVGAFTLSQNESVLLFTEGIFEKLSRNQIEALLARALVELKSPDLKNRSWLSQFLLLIEKPTTMDFIQKRPHTRRFYPVGLFLKQLILYPLCWIPIQLIGVKQNSHEMDEASLTLTGDRRSLSEAYRTMEAYRERTPVLIPFAFHSLFLGSPECVDPIAKVFVRSHSLNRRIYQLEGRALT